MGKDWEICIGMLYKKMYCHKCGTILKRHKFTKTYWPGDKGYKFYGAGHGVNIDGYTKIRYIYKCPQCSFITTYAAQKKISKIQKINQSKILESNTISQILDSKDMDLDLL